MAVLQVLCLIVAPIVAVIAAVFLSEMERFRR